MEKEIIFKLLKRRFLGGVIDLFSFFITYTIFINIFNYLFEYNNTLHIVVFFTILIIYFGGIPKLLNGFTFGGYIFGTKIVSIDNEEITVFKYCLRILYALYSLPKFGVFNFVKVNDMGQLFYDEKFKTTVIDKGKQLDVSEKNIYFEFNFALEWVKFVIILSLSFSILIVFYEFVLK